MKFGGHRAAAQIGEGAFARVFRASDPAGRQVALKVSKSQAEEPDAHARMRREIEVQSTLRHPNIMEILSSDPEEGWFTMPLADGNLDNLVTRGSVAVQDQDAAIAVVKAVLDGLSPAHERGFVHRDITPGNILGLPDGEGLRWVVADWGIVRRPHGTTTVPRTEKGGNRLGTLGYAAPELWSDAHAATPAADVYSVARVAARLLTGDAPVMTSALRPTGILRAWVDECTEPSPMRRPQSAADARALLEEVLNAPTGGPLSHLATGVETARAGAAMSDEAWKVALRHRDDFAAVDLVVHAPRRSIAVWVQEFPEDAAVLSRAISEHVREGWGGGSSFERYDAPLRFVLAVLQALARERRVDDLHDAAAAFFLAEGGADRWKVQNETAEWLRQLRPPVDLPVAQALRAARMGERYARAAERRVASRTILAELGL